MVKMKKNRKKNWSTKISCLPRLLVPNKNHFEKNLSKQLQFKVAIKHSNEMVVKPTKVEQTPVELKIFLYSENEKKTWITFFNLLLKTHNCKPTTFSNQETH